MSIVQVGSSGSPVSSTIRLQEAAPKKKAQPEYILRHPADFRRLPNLHGGVPLAFSYGACWVEVSPWR
jgi:hypothetical protein